MAARVALCRAEAVFRRGTLARSVAEIYRAVGSARPASTSAITLAMAETVATAARCQTGATHALAVLVDLDEGADPSTLAEQYAWLSATAHEVASRRSRIVGGPRVGALGAVEMGLDCLRRIYRVCLCHGAHRFRKNR